MSKKCIWCGAKAVYLGFAGIRYYCPHCEDTLTDDEVINDMTVFEHITESPETLAEKLVFEIFCKEDPNIKGWTSSFTDVHETREQAIAATVAKLQEGEGMKKQK